MKGAFIVDEVRSKPQLIPFLEALKQVGISRNTAIRRIKEHRMPAPMKLGGKVFYNSRHWDEWIEGGCNPVVIHEPKGRRKRPG
jgi:predicted DNA-binding transcriptional regulator AlpA